MAASDRVVDLVRVKASELIRHADTLTQKTQFETANHYLRHLGNMNLSSSKSLLTC